MPSSRSHRINNCPFSSVRGWGRSCVRRHLPRRWVIERCFAWFLRSRSLVRDYERRTDTGEAVVLWSMTMLMSRRLAARHQGSVPVRAA
ncbi:transposase [Streptomyces sp. NPDC085927]|uniref:transposase n=1 Tax=Streptomyces sp. NPDC085927 TaxID=3365738 RepID=UPI0037CDB96A